ncbi:MAG: hypothetical protein GX757_10080 [Clostridiales bacterium]|nr:hypothetical protein [Clostridiales bacterium]
MKEILTRNIGIKILAVILAAILWLVINNIEDPLTVKDFRDIPVKRLNEQAIKSKNQDYQVKDGDKIDITILARRSIADNLKESNFVATADLSKVTDMDTITINISCPGYEDEVIIKKMSQQVMTITREEVVEKRELVKVRVKGEPADGFYVAKKTSNTLVTVSGPKSKIERIKEIIAEVDVTDEAQAGIIKTNEYVKVVDEEGVEIDKSHLTFSQETVPITIEIYPTKIIDVLVTTEGTPADDYYMTNIEYGPKEIEIAGKAEIIDKIDSLTVTENIDGVNSDIKKEINLSDYLDDDLIIVEEDDTAFINITIEKAESKRITIRPDDIIIKNKPSLTVKVQSTGPIILELSGPGSELERVTAKSVTPYIDLYHYTYGSFEVNLQIEKIEDAENVKLAAPVKIPVYLSP